MTQTHCDRCPKSTPDIAPRYYDISRSHDALSVRTWYYCDECNPKDIPRSRTIYPTFAEAKLALITWMLADGP